jgi:hypothetical protein
MSYELTNEAFDAFIKTHDKLFELHMNKGGTDEYESNMSDFVQMSSIDAAIAIDREPIALDWIKEQWVSFEDRSELSHGGNYIAEYLNELNEIIIEVGMYQNNEIHTDNYAGDFIRALPFTSVGSLAK